jgi:hypothetical protein
LPFTAETPLYLLVFASLLLGFILGELHAWIGRHRLKRELRRRAREIEALRRELTATQAQLEGAAPELVEGPSGTIVPPRGRTAPLQPR